MGRSTSIKTLTTDNFTQLVDNINNQSIDVGATGRLTTTVASDIVGAINAGIVSAGINAFYTQLCFGLVIIISVVLQTIIDRKVRKQSITSN